MDTTLVKLLAEERLTDELTAFFAEVNHCVVPLVHSTLLNAGYYQLLASIYERQGQVRQTLEIWVKLCQGQYLDPGFRHGASKVYHLLAASKDQALVEYYGLWLLGRDRSLGLQVRSARSPRPSTPRSSTNLARPGL